MIIVFITRDDLASTQIEKDSNFKWNGDVPMRIHRAVKPKRIGVLEGELPKDPPLPETREYRYEGRNKEVYVYREI